MNDKVRGQHAPAAPAADKRNYGVDLLRIVAMFYVIVLHVVLFSRLRPGSAVCRVIGYFAPCAFAGYILNCQWTVWEHVMKDRFTYLAQMPPWLIPLHVVGFAAGFLLIAMLIDRVRQRLFALLHLRTAAEWVERLARRALSAIVK